MNYLQMNKIDLRIDEINELIDSVGVENLSDQELYNIELELNEIIEKLEANQKPKLRLILGGKK